MTGDALVDACVPLAAELVCVTRDEGPDAIADVLARVPDGRLDALAVVLAAMVDPDAHVAELLAWTDWQPPTRKTGGGRRPLPREHASERGYQQHRSHDDMPACDPCLAAHREAVAGWSETARERAQAVA